MRVNRSWIAGIAVCLVFVLGAALAVAAGVTKSTGGSISAIASGGRENGKFKMSVTGRSAAHVDKIGVRAHKLDRTPDVNGDKPTYRVWLITDDGATAVDFGGMRVGKLGNALFIFDSNNRDLPEGVDTLEMFEFGAIEIRSNVTGAVLRADIGEFKAPRRPKPGGGGGGGYGNGY